MIIRDGFISTGFMTNKRGVTRHFLVQWHSRWRFDFRKPGGKPGYKRLYVGPLEFEWSKFRLPPSPQPHIKHKGIDS